MTAVDGRETRNKTRSALGKRYRLKAARAAGLSLRAPARGKSRREIRTVRSELGLTQTTFARVMSISLRALADFEKGKALGEAARRRLNEVDRLRQALGRVVDPDLIGAWLQEPNTAFGDLKPLEVIERGEIDRLWRMVFDLESGNAG